MGGMGYLFVEGQGIQRRTDRDVEGGRQGREGERERDIDIDVYRSTCSFKSLYVQVLNTQQKGAMMSAYVSYI